MDMSEPNSHYLYQRVYNNLLSVSNQLAARFERLFEAFQECTLDSMNRFWRIQLAALPTNTLAVRSYLRITNIDVWLEDFLKHVMPVIKQYNLPKEF